MVWRNGILVGDTEVTSGIRQGCTGSPQLFVMVVNITINSIVESRMGYRDDDFYVPVLFYADDGLLLARSCGEAEDMIQMVIEVAGECGLNINKGKSNVLLFNHDGTRPEEVGGIRVSNTIRYLGADARGSKMCFCAYRKGKIQLAERMANLTFSVISRSCDKLLIGKTYWKSVVQPRVLSAVAVVVWTKEERKQLQRVENMVWRQILGAPIYTLVAALQGDRSIISGGKRHEDEVKVCKLHGKHCKLAAGSYF